MKTGALNKQIIIESVTEARATDGGTTNTWATFATVWAEFVVLKGSVGVGNESVQADRPVAEANQQIRIRYLSGLTPKMRVKFGTRYFNIRSIVNSGERNREMLLFVTEKVS